MNLHLSEEQTLLCDAMAKLFASESSVERVRAAENSGFDATLWASIHEAGLTTMRVGEANGGLGSSLHDAVLVAEQAGRYLVSVPFAEAIVATRLLAELADTEQSLTHLQQVINGCPISMALQDEAVTETQLINATTEAGKVLILNGDRVFLIALEKQKDEQTQTNLGNLSLRSSTHIESTQGLLLASGRAARATYLAAVEEWKLLNAAMLSGLARRGLELAADYCSQRKAFGRAIGGFQGIAHPLADSITDVEGSQLLNWFAVASVAKQRPDAAANVSMAYWWATQAANRAMGRALHAFGGYGVSLEYDIQLFYRRAKSWSLAGGDPHLELLRTAERLWDGTGETHLPDSGECSIDFGFGAQAEQFALEVQDYFSKNLTTELRAKAHHSTAGYDKAFSQRLAKDGLLFPHWPEAYGGRNADVYDMAAMTAVLEAMNWEHVTAPITNQVAQSLMFDATDEVKDEILTRFATGDALACMGFTEPSCGCDLFAATTRAEQQDNGDWLINGEKIFTSAAHLADYCFLLARTDPVKAKHAGLSVFIVPMSLDGVSVSPLHMLHSEQTNVVNFADVHLPAKYLVGDVNGGLNVMAKTLEMEHGSANEYRLGHVSTVAAAEAWALSATRNGNALLSHSDAAERLARAKTHLAVSTVLCMRAIWAMAEHISHRYWGPMAKMFACEMYHRDANDLMDLAAPDSLITDHPQLSRVELGYRQSIGTTIYGGTSEVQRSLIAEQALGMPKSRT